MVIQAFLLRANLNSQAAFVEPPVARDYRLPSSIYRVFSFGFVPVAVDIFLLRFLIEDPAYSHVVPGTHAPAFFDLDLATDLDPAFFDLYFVGANFLAIVRNDVQGAESLLLKAEKFRAGALQTDYPESFSSHYWDKSWMLPMILGYIYLFEMQDMIRAAPAFLQAGSYANSPAFLKRLSARLNDPVTRYDVLAQLLDGMIRGNPPPAIKAVYEERLRSIRIQQVLYVSRLKVAAELKRPIKDASRLRVKTAFERLRARGAVPAKDPSGGRIFVDASGNIVTDSIYKPAYSLE